MKQNLDLEVKVIRKFIEKSKQDRFIQFVTSPGKRQNFTNELAHFNYFKWSLFAEVVKNEQAEIFHALKNNRVARETCYVISEESEIDTLTMDIKTAISETVGRGMGTILVFGDAEMIFYEGDGFKSRYISQKIV